MEIFYLSVLLPIHAYISTPFVPQLGDCIVSKAFWEARGMEKENMVILALLLGSPGNQLYRPNDCKNISPAPTALLNYRRLPTQHLYWNDEQTLCLMCSELNR